MTKTIEALEKLLENYQTKGHLDKCPLCKLYGCDLCPWKRFTGMSCTEYTNSHSYPFFIGDLRDNQDPEWTKLRIQQITNWIEVLKKGNKPSLNSIK